jgi:hypothetical protein
MLPGLLSGISVASEAETDADVCEPEMIKKILFTLIFFAAILHLIGLMFGHSYLPEVTDMLH